MTRNLFKRCAFAVALTGLLHANVFAALTEVTYRTVILTGQHAPGTEATTFFGSLLIPVMNESGRVAFKGWVYGPGVPTWGRQGIWSEGRGALELIAYENELEPDVESPLRFNVFGNDTTVINDSGQTAFMGGVTAYSRYGGWISDEDGLRLIAREGNVITSLGPDVYLGSMSNLYIDEQARATFLGSFRVTGAGSPASALSYWREDHGTFTMVLGGAEHAPGTPPDVTIVPSYDFTITSDGRIAFLGSLKGPGIDNSNNTGIWIETGNGFELVARNSDIAPGTDGLKFGSFLGEFALNDLGQVAFLAYIGSNNSSDRGIWAGEAGSLQLIARYNDPAPGAEDGSVFNFFWNNAGSIRQPLINNNGDVVFQALLRGPDIDDTNDHGIWVKTGDITKLVVRTGMAAPGTETGTVFEFFDGLSMNDNGQIVITATLTGPDVTDRNDRGIWVYNPDGTLIPIIRTHDMFDVNDDPLITELRQIKSFDFLAESVTEDYRTPAFNHSGQLAFRITFTNNSSGIFVATVPEPGTLIMLSVGSGLLLSRRKHA